MKKHPSSSSRIPRETSMCVARRAALAIGCAVFTAGCISNQERFARIAVRGKGASVRAAAVSELTDQELLARIAVEDHDWHVRKTAAERLTDQALLTKIAAEDASSIVRLSAVEKLTDQTLLARIAINIDGRLTPGGWLSMGNGRYQKLPESFFVFRRIAAEKLTDQALLTKVAIESDNLDISKTALEKLTDQALLAQVAIESEKRDVIKAAVSKLTDQALLARIVNDAKDWEIRLAAVNSLTDQIALEKIVVAGMKAGSSFVVTKQPPDQAVLEQIRLDGESQFLAKIAVARLTDIVTLNRVVDAMHRTDGIFDVACLKLFLTNPATINYVGKTDIQVTGSMKSWPYKFQKDNLSYEVSIPGEEIVVVVKNAKLGKEMSERWRTSFDSFSRTIGFQRADLDLTRIYAEIFKHFPQDALTREVMPGLHGKVRRHIGVEHRRERGP